MKVLGITTVLSLFAAMASAERECPLESDCFQKTCTNIELNKDYKEPIVQFKTVLSADCKNDAGIQTKTSLDLKECLANFNGEFAWANHGNHNCRTCGLKDRKSGTDPVILRCWCEGDLSGMSNINLSYGIWLKDGALGCYDNYGHKTTMNKREI